MSRTHLVMLALLLSVTTPLVATAGTATHGRFIIDYSSDLEGSLDTMSQQLDRIFDDLDTFLGTRLPASAPIRIEALSPDAYARKYGMQKQQIYGYGGFVRLTALYQHSTRTVRIEYTPTPTFTSNSPTIMESILIHECMHAYFDAIRPGYTAYTPIWFTEGIATYTQTALNRSGTKITPTRMRVSTPLNARPYENGEAAIRYLVEEKGIGRFQEFIRRFVATGKFDESLNYVFSLSTADLQEALRTW